MRLSVLRALGRSALARGDAAERLLARGVDREDPIEARDLEDLRDVLVGRDECEMAAAGAQPLDGADQDAERRGADDRRLREVYDELLLAALAQPASCR